MELKLKLFMIFICLVFSAFIYKKILDDKLQVGYSLIWFLVMFVLIFVTVFDEILNPIKLFLGFEKISNMLFVFGFFITSIIIFNIYLRITEQNKKIIKLTQEIALLKKESK